MNVRKSILNQKKSPRSLKNKEKHFTVVAIGASAGGLEAVSELLKNLPSSTGMAFIYVQHLSPDHKSLLTPILSKLTKMKVQEIDDMELIKPNNVYVIPPNKGIKVTDGHIKLFPRSRGVPTISIDVLFTSLAETHKKNVMGVILSGYASDGMKGLKAIKDAGGVTFAQDDSAQAGSMPKSAIASGIVDFILPPKKIAAKLALLSKQGFPNIKVNISEKKENIEYTKPDLNNLFETLKKEKGIDYNYYKFPTVKRRLKHRMLKCNTKTIEDYIKLLTKDKNELELLYNDLLINVTNFFRDSDVFKYLKTTLLPKLLKNKSEDDVIRIWVPACSSGQEAYSIAMLLTDLQEKNAKKIPIKIFATDVSDHIIRNARRGEYTPGDLKSISKQHLARFFIQQGDNFQIVKELREMCVFAVHNILRDPPFSRMDFISCRNMLIYFEPFAQKQVFNTLNFALKEDGYLLLGKAETIGTTSTLFTPVNKNFKLFSRKKSTGVKKIPELTPYLQPKVIQNKNVLRPSVNPTKTDSAIDAVLLSNYTPACVLINADMEIIQSRGSISTFLKLATGKATLNILKLTRSEFGLELRNLILKTIKTNKITHKAGIDLKIESVPRKMSIEVRPLEMDANEPLYLVLFILPEKPEKISEREKSGKPNYQLNKRIKDLEDELNNLRLEMNSLIDSQDKTLEDLQSSNEENVSANEEFQTLNEELETSKEEIEATNEELNTTNQELQIRNDLLTESKEYSDAITSTIHEPMLVLHTDFRVKSANTSFYNKFHLQKSETEGKVLFELGNRQWNIPKLRELLNELVTRSRGFKNLEVSGTFPDIGEKTMLLNANLIVQNANREKLILLAIEDITELSSYYIKENSERKKAELKFRGFLESAPDAIVIVNNDGKIQLVNSQTEKMFGYNREEIIGKEIEVLLPSRYKDSHPGYRKTHSENPKTRIMGEGLDLFAQHKEGREFPVEISLSQLETDEGKMVSAAIRDITKQKRVETELVESKLFAEKSKEIAEVAMQAKQQFLSTMSHEILTPMNAIIGFTKVILKTDLSTKQKEYMNAIKTSGDALIVLINDILDLAKVEAGKIVFEETPFEISTSITSMLHIFESKIYEKNLSLIKEYDTKIPEVVLGDPLRLNQIILNLVSNAIKFTSEGEIKVGVRLIDEDKNQVTVEFSVSDTGIGIPENQITNIFENFQQASSNTSRLYGGTGLGLAIVKQLVERQGGTIAIKSKVGRGSTFSFTLKFQKTTEGVKSESIVVKQDSGIKNIKVLVVEDVALNQLLMKTLLDDFGFEQDMAENGKIAIEKLKTNEYDIILMDLQMPEMNGFEATEYIRKTMSSEIPILATTADVTTVDVEKCKAVGMNDYLAKPVDEKLLYSKIVGLIKKQVPPLIQKDRTITPSNKYKYIDLTHVTQLTKAKPKLIMEIISLYLEQTPALLQSMKESYQKKNWNALYSAVHKMLPSFAIIGISKPVEKMAHQIQNAALAGDSSDRLSDLISQVDLACANACKELQKELKMLAQNS